jgi:hypothetical protein
MYISSGRNNSKQIVKKVRIIVWDILKEKGKWIKMNKSFWRKFSKISINEKIKARIIMTP